MQYVTRFLSTFLFIVVLLMSSSVFALAEDASLSLNPMTCLQCHNKKVNANSFAKSVHGHFACTACHSDTSDIKSHVARNRKAIPPDCSRCHKNILEEHATSVHFESGIGCTDCHSDIHNTRSAKNDKKAIADKCITCHSEISIFFESSHGRAMKAGSKDAPTCSDCHNLHAIARQTNGDRGFHTKACMKCHADEGMMKRNNVFSLGPKTYFESYHGKNVRLGFPEKVAGCSDCHTAHHVLPASDPKSSVHSDNLTKTCAQCHTNATPLFARYYPHAEHTDRENYPLLFYTFLAMTGLLIGSFAFFWLHSLLWFIRGFIHNRELAARMVADGKAHHVVPDGKKLYRRFRPIHIFMHLLVIVSFLGLSLTGLPLKFNNTEWARWLMNFYGGTAHAGLIHRICAGMITVSFLIAVVMSAHFLFFNKKLKGNPIERFFGPDSLFINFRDIQDVIDMFRWFFFKGEKPTFERWTYWEKFDFIAVFWGMFAIGGSGLMLWFPEIFAKFLPGWAFNIATIIHSDEALLATGFIFTVHFFNTHFRPEKFPMDFVIFNGHISKEEMIEERADQWERYKNEGTTEEYRVKAPSPVAWDFFLKTFGFIALLIGSSLVFLMAYAFLKH